jgi:Fe-S cluster assembly protein SufD
MNIPQQHYREVFAQVRGRLPGAGVPWVTRMRSQAMTAFQQTPFPDMRVEDWKYTDLRHLNRHLFSPTDATTCITNLSPWLFDGTPMHGLVFVDGRRVETPQPFSPILAGATLSNLVFALNACPEHLEPVLGRTLEADRPGFDAMNSAFLQDGAWLRLERDVELKLPVHLLFISTGQADSMQTVRNVIHAGPRSSATVIESWVALDDSAALTNTVTEITLEEGASLDHYTLVQEGAGTTHFGGTYVRQHRDSRLGAHSIALCGQLVRNTLQVDLEGEGAECTLNGLTLTQGRAHVDNHTRIEHHRPHATSDELYKGILADRSRTVFSGRIVVHPHAQQTCARQGNHSLLLSADAEADARPQFEIRADNVKCAHGCTVGELDTDALFYLRARGLDDADARRLLVRAFAADVLDRLPLAPVRNYLEHALSSRLAGGRKLHQEEVALQ